MSRVFPRQVFNILCLRLRFSPLALATEFMRTVFWLIISSFIFLMNAGTAHDHTSLKHDNSSETKPLSAAATLFLFNRKY